TLLVDSRAESKIRQGVTTEILGESESARAEDWRGGLRFPEDFGSDALANFALRPAVHQQRVVAVAVEVYETRRDDQARRINHALPRGIYQTPDGHDPSVTHRHCAARPRAAAAIKNVAVRDDEVVFGLFGTCSRRRPLSSWGRARDHHRQ